MSRREYTIKEIVINREKITRVIIDSHVDKHKDITDDVILDLVRLLNDSEQFAEDMKGPFSYYANLLILDDLQYKIVWLLEENEIYIGVITVYRDRRSK